jgi:hypothetical protein
MELYHALATDGIEILTDSQLADGGNNTALEALQALQYEGTKAEIAQGFKEQGNEMVKAKMWRDAKEFYTKGIVVLTAKGADDKWEKGEDPELQAKKERELEEQIYVNRALCHLELSTRQLVPIWMLSLTKRTRELPLHHSGLCSCPPSQLL